jgi:hypothetical protein
MFFFAEDCLCSALDAPAGRQVAKNFVVSLMTSKGSGSRVFQALIAVLASLGFVEGPRNSARRIALVPSPAKFRELLSSEPEAPGVGKGHTGAAPDPSAAMLRVIAIPEVGGLHHLDERRAA